MTVRYTAEDVTLDNRDIGTTWLTLPNGDVVEVDPWELLENVLENAFAFPEDFVQRLNVLRKDVEKELSRSPSVDDRRPLIRTSS